MIGVIGLGLIGGSLAKALNQNTDYTVYGYDREESTTRKAILVGAIEGALSEEMIAECELLIVALWPKATVTWITRHADQIKPGTTVMDCGGVKQYVCQSVWPLAEKHGFLFVGGHPMAGLEHSGFEHSKRALFDKASMVLTPPPGTPIESLESIKSVCTAIGFSHIEITTPVEHDHMIAFTSQLAHVVSSAYIQSPTAANHQGFSAGSYRDLTRVAKLNEEMWTELFLENPAPLADEIDGITERLATYSQALRSGDAETLRSLLRRGREQKESIDQEVF